MTTESVRRWLAEEVKLIYMWDCSVCRLMDYVIPVVNTMAEGYGGLMCKPCYLAVEWAYNHGTVVDSRCKLCDIARPKHDYRQYTRKTHWICADCNENLRKYLEQHPELLADPKLLLADPVVQELGFDPEDSPTYTPEWAEPV